MTAKKPTPPSTSPEQTGPSESGQPVHEVLYERVTGESEEVVVHPGRAASHVEVSTPLPVDVHARLQAMSAAITRSTGCHVPVSTITRAMVEVMLVTDPDLDACRSEADVVAVLKRALRG